MEPARTDGLKLPDMVMCGDHPSITKTELNSKEAKVVEEKEKDKKIRTSMFYARISPTSSREKTVDTEYARSRAASEHALKSLAKSRARSHDAALRPEGGARGGEFVRAALGSFRWPPYLVCVWVLVLVLTHALHCVVAMLEKALPAVRKLCQYFRAWTQESWSRDVDFNKRLHAVALGCATALLYAAYCALAATHGLALWAVRPLCADGEDEPISEEAPRVTSYVDVTDTASRQ